MTTLSDSKKVAAISMWILTRGAMVGVAATVVKILGRFL